MIEISTLKQTGYGCPSQFNGITADNREVYVRFRWGKLGVYIDGQKLIDKQLSDGLDGIINYKEVKENFNDLIKWPEELSVDNE